jgi:hypothetical protein
MCTVRVRFFFGPPKHYQGIVTSQNVGTLFTKDFLLESKNCLLMT